MTLQDIWGAPTWRLLHTLIENINNETNENYIYIQE